MPQELIDLNIYKGVPVKVTPGGYFTATIGAVSETAGTYAAVCAWIDKELNAAVKLRTVSLPIVGLSKKQGDETISKVTHVLLRGLNRTTRDPQYDQKGVELNYALPDTPANVARLERLAVLESQYTELRADVQERTVRYRNGYGRIDVEEYVAALVGLETAYKKALALDTVEVEI